MGAIPPGFAIFAWPWLLSYAPLYTLVWLKRNGFV